MDIPLILNYLRPTEQWTLTGDEYAGLEWLSDTPKPTEDEIVAAEAAALEHKQAEAQAQADSQAAAIAHAKSLGFTDAMIAVMYPNLGAQNE